MEHAAEEIVDGAAREIARHVMGAALRQKPSDGFYQAARALLDLYAESNDVPTYLHVARLYASQSPRRIPDRTIGKVFADAALSGDRYSFMQVPSFRVELDGDELVWEGDAAPSARDNPPWKPDGVVSSGPFQTYYRDGRKSWSFDMKAMADDWAKEIGGFVEERGPRGYAHYARNPVGDARRVRLEHDDDLGDGYVGDPTGDFIATRVGAGDGDFDIVTRLLHGGGKSRRWERTEGGEWTIAARNPVGDHVDVVRGPGRGRSGVVESETEHVARVRFDRGGAGHLERSALRTKGPSRR